MSVQAVQMESTIVPARSGRGVLVKIRSIVFVLSFLGLGSLNIFMLTNERVHDAAYLAIKAALAVLTGDAISSQMLSKSPTARSARNAAVATRKLRDEVASLSASNAALGNKHAALERSHRDIEKKNAELQRTLSRQAAVVQRATNRMTLRTLRGASRNVTSVAAQAIPFVGPAIIVGVTALNVRDACETLKDANELNVGFDLDQVDHAAVCGMRIPTKEQAWAQVNENWKGAFQSASAALNEAGTTVVPVTDPVPSWHAALDTLCKVLGSVPNLCK